MQSKIFNAAVAALSLPAVQCAVAPRQISITPGLIVLPGITIDPNTLGPQLSVFQTLDLVREDVGKTINLVNQITNTTAGTLLGTVSVATTVVGQVTNNVGTILDKVTQLTNLITPTLPAPTTPAPPNLPDIGGTAETVSVSIDTPTSTRVPANKHPLACPYGSGAHQGGHRSARCPPQPGCRASRSNLASSCCHFAGDLANRPQPRRRRLRSRPLPGG
ncbi:hypothetical protein CGRA01v4_06280 [Colletotrichum graminicola]|nr:hypothetical protein CGRA01v4_06280 [Colletotrichum graminicola]